MHEIDFHDGLSNEERLRLEIARSAARWIADEGLDYGQAKAKAAADLARHARGRNLLPDNEAIDEALREHLALFDPQSEERLVAMRRAALSLMEGLAAFRPYLSGAIWKGLAHEHAVIQIDLFADNPKEVHYYLLNERLDFEPVELASRRAQEPQEGFALEFDGWPSLLLLHPTQQQHNQGKERGDLVALRRLVDRSTP